MKTELVIFYNVRHFTSKKCKSESNLIPKLLFTYEYRNCYAVFVVCSVYSSYFRDFFQAILFPQFDVFCW